jgi:hypothetical protein
MHKMVVETALSQGDLGELPLERALLTPRQVTAILKISRRTLCYWSTERRRRGPKLPPVRLGRCTRYQVRDVLALIEERKTS